MKYKLTYMAPSIFVYECAVEKFNTFEEAMARIPALLKKYPPRQDSDYIKIEKVEDMITLNIEALRSYNETN